MGHSKSQKKNKNKKKNAEISLTLIFATFLDLTPKAMGAKRKMNIQTYIKLKFYEKQR